MQACIQEQSGRNGSSFYNSETDAMEKKMKYVVPKQPDLKPTTLEQL